MNHRKIYGPTDLVIKILVGVMVVLFITAFISKHNDEALATCQQEHSADVCLYSLR
jgi:hypothetical protein